MLADPGRPSDSNVRALDHVRIPRRRRALRCPHPSPRPVSSSEQVLSRLTSGSARPVIMHLDAPPAHSGGRIVAHGEIAPNRPCLQRPPALRGHAASQLARLRLTGLTNPWPGGVRRACCVAASCCFRDGAETSTAVI